MSNSKSTNDPFKCVMIVSKRINGGSVIEDVKIEVGESGVVLEFVFEEMEKLLGSEGGFKMIVEEVS